MLLKHLDNLSKISIVFLVVPWIAFLIVSINQYRHLRLQTLRIQILSTRLSTFLPFYATILFLCVLLPEAFLGLQIVIAIIEAISFYCFFAMLVANLGGPDNTIAEMEKKESQPLCCGCVCPTTPAAYYSRLQWSLFHFMTTRVVLVIIQAICGYKGLTSAAAIFSLLSFCLVVNAFLSLVLLYEMVYTISGNLKATLKIVLMKLSVILIVIQGLFEEFLFDAGKLNNLNFNDTYPPSENGYRAYCFLVLIEFCLFAFVYGFAFSSIMVPNPHVKPIRNSSVQSGTTSASGPLLEDVPNMSFLHFLFEIFAFCDMYGTLTPKSAPRVEMNDV